MKRKLTKPERLEEIRRLVDRLENEAESLDYMQKCQLEFDKWQHIHKYIHDSPFRTNLRKKRSEQWREAVNEIRHIGDDELLEWCLLQVEVAGNIERGVREMRPRKNGPCHPLIMEYTGNRKRKALAILHFAREGDKHGLNNVDSKWHARTADILKRHGLIETDEDGNPVYSTDPMWRS